LQPILFHARFALCDRLDIEAEVLRRFGRNSAGAARRAVLVATQVIEQSLDLDFDLLCTDLAPADLLIQRAGRLWRHERNDRPVATAELLVVSPEPVENPTADWVRGSLPGTAAVYRDPALLWRTARAVFGKGAIVTPDDMRPLVEAAADGDVPKALSPQAQRAEGKDRGDAQAARQNALDVDKGYRRGDSGWEPELIIRTRLEEPPQVTLRLARERDGAVVPYAEDGTPARAWALSEVTTGRHRIAACPSPPHLAAAAEAARAGWGRWERESPHVLLAVLTAESDRYRLDARTKAGGTVLARYDPRLGLLLPRPTLG
jgi:CRISPR-associated endonuclease/helicase Cas3